MKSYKISYNVYKYEDKVKTWKQIFNREKAEVYLKVYSFNKIITAEEQPVVPIDLVTLFDIHNLRIEQVGIVLDLGIDYIPKAEKSSINYLLLHGGI